MQNISEATSDFETWLALQMPLNAEDLAFKHAQMRKSAFLFMRATFYRWAQIWPTACASLSTASAVLSVGDLHIENFGTWRDSEGRLIWGINDFDEAYLLPYTNDLVRLATSTLLAIRYQQIKVDAPTACKAIVDGYIEFIECGGRPFVLAERKNWLRELAQSQLRDPGIFWDKILALPDAPKQIDPVAIKLLEDSLPERGLDYHLVRRRTGLGSLGRPRFVALVNWRGGMIAREVKAVATSACVWAMGKKPNKKFFNKHICIAAVRCQDPAMNLRSGWIVRRLSPDSMKLTLEDLPSPSIERILHAMGRETANVHLGSSGAIRAVRNDLKKRQKNTPEWLLDSATKMVGEIYKDWKEL
jgi:hypothetical protein